MRSRRDGNNDRGKIIAPDGIQARRGAGANKMFVAESTTAENKKPERNHARSGFLLFYGRRPLVFIRLIPEKRAKRSSEFVGRDNMTEFCKNFDGLAVIDGDPDTDLLVARLRCGMWDCEYCARKNRAIWRAHIIDREPQQGIEANDFNLFEHHVTEFCHAP